MYEGKVTVERLVELGERHLERDELDEAIHYYNTALKASPLLRAACMGRAEACFRKGQKGDSVFYVLAMESLRSVIKSEPASSADVHEKLIIVAMKAGKLGDLAVEYRERLKKEPENRESSKYLNRIYLLSLLEKDIKVPLVTHRPILFVKVFFDCILLPFSSSMILTANFVPKARPSLGIGVFVFVSYLVYRFLIYIFSRR